MTYDKLRERILAHRIAASDGDHSMRLWRIAEDIRDHLRAKDSEDRLLHLMARVGEFSRGLGKDLRRGHTSAEEAAILLSQLADLGDLSFGQWLHRS